MAKVKKNRKWSVVSQIHRTYAGSNGRVEWTKDLSEALQIAAVIPGGKVVDTDWLSTHWSEWRDNGVIPAEARPPEPAMSFDAPVPKIKPMVISNTKGQ